MSDKIRENTSRRIVELIKKSNLNFQTNLLDRKSDQELNKIIEGEFEKWIDKND